MIDGNSPLQTMLSEAQRRFFTGETQTEVTAFVSRELARIASTTQPEDILDVPQSVEFYRNIMAEREAFFNLPAEEQRRLLFPWPSWNNLLDPLPGGMLMTIAGADGAGKTTYGECISEYYAALGFKVAYFHFELSHTVMLDRRAARHTGMSIRQLKGYLTADEKQRVEAANARILTWAGNIHYVHCPAYQMEQVVRDIQALQAEGKCEVAIIDYLEKAAPSPIQLRTYGNNAYQREADNVEQLKSCAERIGIPIVMLAQLNKHGKGVSVDDLDKTHVRGAGEKTEKANVVILLHREQDDAGVYSNIVDVKVHKNTLGPMGRFRQGMTPQYFRVDDNVERVELPRGNGR